MPDRKQVIVRLERKAEPYLADVLKSKEFLPFKITRKKENPDFLKSFSDLPILLVIEKEVIEDEDKE